MPAPVRALGIDLAIRDARDIGVALVEEAGVTLLPVPFRGRPDLATVAAWIEALAIEQQVAVVSIDGPLGWKGLDTESPHCRLGERAVRAPGKTGLPPDGVKPAGYLGFTRFSIALFEQLTMHTGWRLPGDPRDATAHRVLVTECFPTAIWRGLGLSPLPGKQKATASDVAAWAERLALVTGLTMTTMPSHDGLQAVVAAYAGWCLARQDTEAHLAGAPPFRLDDTWREGYILSIASPVRR